ncbi:class I SAM-dependent methyltransferase [Mycolicibacterium mucogenicum]|uniref:Class I SAM-dependent methyltransferase n=1 Tax=Mycolicibacterium mucogenicum DSM 44124 TaxID=1226753 RepID=A0A8H2J859_MYCMU|nr:class I SAM-dependent methyltransferase [Mycolicibacterium mucogenicum]QPG72079.1 methyltransferase domain-containing protein [Mycolicibacterium mucogenicum DSM 44124]
MSETNGRVSNWAGDLFEGTAWHYARFRPNYPAVVINDLVQQLRLDGTGRLLDLGCGTGQLTLPLAGHVAEAVGVDPESGMLAEATRRAEAQGVTNVFWRQGSSAHIPVDLGRFSIVTVGRAFHWMDRAQVLVDLDDMVDDDGALVIVNDTNLLFPSAPWQQAIQDTQRSFIPTYDQAISPSSVDDSRTHEQILVSSPFSRVGREVYRYRRSWTIERIVGYLYSTSLPLRRLLGDRQSAFEEAMSTALLAINPSDRFIESVALEVFTATKT